jgi:hypothetical protein
MPLDLFLHLLRALPPMLIQAHWQKRMLHRASRKPAQLHAHYWLAGQVPLLPTYMSEVDQFSLHCE